GAVLDGGAQSGKTVDAAAPGIGAAGAAEGLVAREDAAADGEVTDIIGDGAAVALPARAAEGLVLGEQAVGDEESASHQIGDSPAHGIHCDAEGLVVRQHDTVEDQGAAAVPDAAPAAHRPALG